MRQFTIKPRMFGSDFFLVERSIETPLPEFFKSFMMQYSGLSFEEEYFIDKGGVERIIKRINTSIDVYNLTKEFKDHGWGLKVPFAHDEGGWHYCLSFDEDTYGKIIINRWNSYPLEEQFLVISDSFEEFINSLEKRPDSLK